MINPMLFVSHASEDKESFVRPLAHALKAKGIPVWYDEFSLRLGDSLRRSIDRGLVECTGGLVVLCPAFFAKEWPQRELDALFAAEIAGRSHLIPIWHGLGLADVLAVSPLLADRFAVNSDLGVAAVAQKIAELFPVPAKISGSLLADVLESFLYPGMYAGEAQYKASQYRFLQLNAFKEDYIEVLDATVAKLSDEEIDNFPTEIETALDRDIHRLRKKHRIPGDVYLTSDEPVPDDGLSWWMESLGGWVSGALSREHSAQLVNELDLQELDEYYVLLDVPNFSISSDQRPLLEQALVELGCGYEHDYAPLREICSALRSLDG
jgi:hypothetical protein